MAGAKKGTKDAELEALQGIPLSRRCSAFIVFLPAKGPGQEGRRGAPGKGGETPGPGEPEGPTDKNPRPKGRQEKSPQS